MEGSVLLNTAYLSVFWETLARRFELNHPYPKVFLMMGRLARDLPPYKFYLPEVYLPTSQPYTSPPNMACHAIMTIKLPSTLATTCDSPVPPFFFFF